MPDLPKVFYVDLKQDDPKKSTMRKLRDLGMAVEVPGRNMNRHLVLRMDAGNFLLPKDRGVMEKIGICIIEGSWKRDNLLQDSHVEVERKLPVLVASNPVNYGKIEKLSSAEALSAALYIAGFTDQAKKIMSKFHWGHTFLELNGNLLEDYSKAGSEAELVQVEKEYGFRV
ncbi:MAG: DUF367 family protein [Candidatus Thermoplasmatota archaeon]|jgi:pre-rRNA-processing protein TSR3|nr:DUF367 family protein [Candidatus Thermoplasmatota archaeon]MCL5791060.1 DUF367 family protein [Candidatus Thermoplasmatota archaeon]